MSLEARHIRFALDLKDEYKIKDIEKYISGTIYPDSRYVTGIDRNLTHHNDILKSEFAKDDFKKGWQVHQICDMIMNREKTKVLPDLFVNECADFNKERWIISSAMKIIQDMNDMQKFDLQKNLEYLEFAYNPNGENLSDIKKYNQIIINLYKNKKVTTVDDYYKIWFVLGINKEQGDKIKEKTEEFLKYKRLVKKIEAIYDDMIANYKKVLF